MTPDAAEQPRAIFSTVCPKCGAVEEFNESWMRALGWVRADDWRAAHVSAPAQEDDGG